jgi:hypothetical protein
MVKNVQLEIVEWLNDLFGEVIEPTYFDRAKIFSLLIAEVESWESACYSGNLADSTI